MCGIYLSICKHTTNSPQQNKNESNEFVLPNTTLDCRLRSRGPDSYGKIHRQIQSYNVTFISTVLSLRSRPDGGIQRQPFSRSQKCSTSDVHDSGLLLLWNGEAWAIGNTRVEEGDTAAVFDHVSAALEAGEDVVIDALNDVSGPFATVFYDGCSKIYVARDCLGRRSLVWRRLQAGGIEIASVGDDTEGWEEVEAEGVIVFDLKNVSDANAFGIDDAPPFHRIAQTTNDHGETRNGRDHSSIRLWSYADAGKYASLNRSIPSAENGYLEPLTVNSNAIQKLEQLLRASMRDRVENISTPPTFATSTRDAESESKLAILFSGGLDCTLLSRITHDHLPPDQSIDLLTVAFHNPRSHGTEATSSAYESCPDRITARSSVAELRAICPERTWRLVLIDVPYSEMLAHRDIVRSLMAPHNTEMDLSIAMALYFAARGIGRLDTDSDRSPVMYRSPARVLISGLGADELFGGYQRHSTAFARHGYGALLEELELDITRLGKRNLGRDDRVIAHWGREARYPYLDETFVRWAVEAPLLAKCGFGPSNVHHGIEAGSQESEKSRYNREDTSHLEPGKLALRLLAYKLGMRRVAAERKRAIQFGARTAKLGGGGKTKGTQLVT